MLLSSGEPSSLRGTILTEKPSPRGAYLATLSLGAIGVVYGDIGTSPLYAIRECFHGPHAVAINPQNVLGVLSCVFWAIVVVIAIKYQLIVMRANNKGEGGILALTSLVRTRKGARSGRHWGFIALGLFGASLFYGDGMITPAISVLSAIEGLEVATPLLAPYVVPITIVILIGLFLIQARGTAGVGKIFGPVTILWFAVLATLGTISIAHTPGVLAAINPSWAFHFFVANQWTGFLVLGAVFLVVTGGEALYADMGHFGPLPIRLTWYGLVMPALLLNYFGQGALLLRSPESAANPFYHLAPEWALYPMVILAAAATVIASQAVISGVFSLTRQAMQLGYSPRMDVRHTSEREIGQIYMPGMNWALMVACILLVIGFRSSSNLAAAYGIAVSMTMLITTLLIYIVARDRWKLPRWAIAIPVAFFLAIDVAFFAANSLKIFQGGWFPLAIALGAFTLLTTWKRGRMILDERLNAESLPVEVFIDSVSRKPPARVAGTAVFMYRNRRGIPTALLHNIKHNKVLHETVVLLTVVVEDVPHTNGSRVEASSLGEGMHQVVMHFGFMDDPDVPAELHRVELPGVSFAPEVTSYFLGRETLIATNRPGMAIWREKLFASMSANARSAASYFNLPPNRVIELGAQIQL